MTTEEVVKPFAAEDEENVIAAASQIEAMSAEEVIQWAGKKYGSGLALTVSFGGAGGMVLLDLVMKHAPGTPVLFIDTGVLFEQTYKLVDEVEKKYNIRVQRLNPRRTLEQQAAEFGDKLWEFDPNLCCHMRKVEPLAEALKPYRAWMTALRRDQSETRANTPIAGWNKKHRMVKISPLANWTEQRTWEYVYQNVLPYNELLTQGYTSLGCHTCTRKPTNGDARSGRWVGFNKTECGLHVGENI